MSDLVEIALPVGPTGLVFMGNPPFVDKVETNSPLADKVEFGYFVVSLAVPNEETLKGASFKDLKEKLDATADKKGRILTLSKTNPLATSKPKMAASTTKADSPAPTTTKHLIFKKSWKGKSSAFSFHGASMTQKLADLVQSEWSNIKVVKDAKPLRMRAQIESGTYYVDLDDNFQKNHEEAAIVAVMDALALAGWKFKCQYDSESGSSKTSVFVFEN